MKQIALLSATLITLVACNDQKEYDATGIFEATTVTISSETSGKILMLDLNEGDDISTGQRVGIIDTTLLVLQQKQLQSQQPHMESEPKLLLLIDSN